LKECTQAMISKIIKPHLGLLIGLLVYAQFVRGAEEAAPLTPSKASTKLEISSDNWKADQKTGTYHYKKNVILKWGEVKVTANTLSRQINTQTQLEEIVAEGMPVVLTFTDPKTKKTVFARGQDFTFVTPNNHIILKNKASLTISQGETIETDIQARQIDLHLDGSKIDSVEAAGKPVRFSHQLVNGKRTQAQAQQLTLEYAAQKVHLIGAKVEQGTDTFKAESLYFDVLSGQLSASGEGENRPSMILDIPTNKPEKTKVDVIVPNNTESSMETHEPPVPPNTQGEENQL